MEYADYLYNMSPWSDESNDEEEDDDCDNDGADSLFFCDWQDN
jgi:hypothetical protein